MKKKFFILTLVVVSMAIAVSSWAEERPVTNEELMREIRALKTRVAELETRLGTQEVVQERKWLDITEEFERIDAHVIHRDVDKDIGLEIEGIRIGTGATFITQYAMDPNSVSGDDDVVDGTYTIDLEFASRVGKSGVAFLHLEAGQGAGLDGDEITTFSNVNRDAGNSNMDVQVTEVWYEHIFFDGKALCTAGKLGVDAYFDSNEAANNETTQFLNASFRNSSSLEFPDDNTYGFRLALLPVDWAEFNMGIFDDDADWEDIFEDTFSIAQINLKPNLLGRKGHYRIYGWYDDSNHTKWADPGTTTQPNFGFGTSCDQRLCDYLTWFGRFGWEDPDVSIIEWAWSTGFQVDGMPWGRDSDHLGIAVGMDVPGGDYDNVIGNRGDPEGHLEIYYNIYLNDHLSISPDYQLIWNPNGSGNDPINIFGVRGQIDF